MFYNYVFFFFGSAKALPLIKRGKYKHLCGSKRDEPYTLFDIFSVSNVTVITMMLNQISSRYDDFLHEKKKCLSPFPDIT